MANKYIELPKHDKDTEIIDKKSPQMLYSNSSTSHHKPNAESVNKSELNEHNSHNTNPQAINSPPPQSISFFYKTYQQRHFLHISSLPSSIRNKSPSFKNKINEQPSFKYHIYNPNIYRVQNEHYPHHIHHQHHHPQHSHNTPSSPLSFSPVDYYKHELNRSHHNVPTPHSSPKKSLEGLPVIYHYHHTHDSQKTLAEKIKQAHRASMRRQSLKLRRLSMDIPNQIRSFPSNRFHDNLSASHGYLHSSINFSNPWQKLHRKSTTFRNKEPTHFVWENRKFLPKNTNNLPEVCVLLNLLFFYD